MSKKANGIATIENAWKDAAEEETRPSEIPAAYENNRCLPNIASILSACKVAIKSGVTYENGQLIKYEDLLVAPRNLTFSIKGQTNQAGGKVSITPEMITSMSLNDVALSSAEILAAHQGDGTYLFSNYQNTRVKVVINATYSAQSITYREYTEDNSFKGINEKLLYLRDINGHELTELKYTWAVSERDIDLNFFVIKKNQDSSYTMVGMLGYDQSAMYGLYWPVKGITKKISSNTWPSDCDFCLSLDIDDTGDGNLTEVLSIFPVDMTWNEIMENYNFVYAAIDFNGNGTSMPGMTMKLSSDFIESEEIELVSTQSTINSWMICRFGADTGGQVIEYKNAAGTESLVYDSNSVEVPSSISLVGMNLEIKTGSDWTTT